MDWNVMVQYLPQYEKAAWLTLRLGVAGISWVILVGLVCAVLQYEDERPRPRCPHRHPEASV